MSANFLHGTETIEVSNGDVVVSEVKTAVIGLVGVAPKGPSNTLQLIRSTTDAAIFGDPIPGFSIPQALAAIFAHGTGTILVVNVFDDAKHTEAVVDEAQTVTNGALKLASAPIDLAAVTLKDDAGEASTYIAGTDYTLDQYGRFIVIKGRIPNDTVIKFSYSKLKALSVLSTDIIGTVSETGVRTGMKLWDLAFNSFGFKPKILIAPNYSSTPAVSTAMLTNAIGLRAVALIDSVAGETVPDALTNRVGAADSSFNTADKRAVLLYPFLKAYDASKDDGDPNTDTNTNYPFSQFYAGLMAATDRDLGYWYSPSNQLLKGITGIERELSASLNDENCDTNTLNAAGITTVFNSFGTGFLAWGNRNASFPSNTQPDSFISMRRIADVVHESLELASLPFIDKPLNQAIIDEIRNSGNNFMNVLIGRGAILEGSKITFNRDQNPPADLAAGKVKFSINFMGAVPTEQITFLSTIDTSLYSVLK
ncbi:phage tail sheath family protein [Arachidicoccus terrestris]|uniref:phage tail sheath family protein n=1 Tax=Arachidicoccus terrestris TaxID=2875539 RepID=UPI001CC3F526|nr:phage tail sheath subtilisin-like domain-containing protein [Arachidicoccus terrestris]UAY56263.1 phage tail sheath subtilisin-like domain-containing protein [Arachidicoccus terrestris]